MRWQGGGRAAERRRRGRRCCVRRAAQPAPVVLKDGVSSASGEAQGGCGGCAVPADDVLLWSRCRSAAMLPGPTEAGLYPCHLQAGVAALRALLYSCLPTSQASLWHAVALPSETRYAGRQRAALQLPADKTEAGLCGTSTPGCRRSPTWHASLICAGGGHHHRPGAPDPALHFLAGPS